MFESAHNRGPLIGALDEILDHVGRMRLQAMSEDGEPNGYNEAVGSPLTKLFSLDWIDVAPDEPFVGGVSLGFAGEPGHVRVRQVPKSNSVAVFGNQVFELEIETRSEFASDWLALQFKLPSIEHGPVHAYFQLAGTASRDGTVHPIIRISENNSHLEDINLEPGGRILTEGSLIVGSGRYTVPRQGAVGLHCFLDAKPLSKWRITQLLAARD